MSSVAEEMRNLFNDFNSIFEQKDLKRQRVQEIVQDLYAINREVWFELQKIHQSPSDEKQIRGVTERVSQTLTGVSGIFDKILEAIGDDPVDAYSGHWRNVMSDFCFAVAYVTWLDSKTLATKDDVAKALSLTTEDGKADSRVGVDVEEYLHGLVGLPKELSRLCLNAVRDNNFELPQAISSFVQELYSGFRLLNLRNDSLRRKFDAIKYDVQRIEEVLYDLTVRKLGEGEESKMQD